MNDILAAIEVLLNRPVNRIYLASRSFDVPANVLEHLAWSPQVSFEAGLTSTFH